MKGGKNYLPFKKKTNKSIKQLFQGRHQRNFLSVRNVQKYYISVNPYLSGNEKIYPVLHLKVLRCTLNNDLIIEENNKDLLWKALTVLYALNSFCCVKTEIYISQVFNILSSSIFTWCAFIN